MSDQLDAIVAAQPMGPESAFDPAPPQVLLMAAQEAVRRLCWGTMHYRCRGCSFEWEIWLALGVEGPPHLKQRGLALACPFGIGRCYAWPRDAAGELTTCDGEMLHVDFNRDEHWASPRLAPDDVPRFVLPRMVSRGDQGAELEIPESALVAARKWHSEGQA